MGKRHDELSQHHEARVRLESDMFHAMHVAGYAL